MPTQKDIEEFGRVWKEEYGETLTFLEAKQKLEDLLRLLRDMQKTLGTAEPQKSEPPPGFMGF